MRLPMRGTCAARRRQPGGDRRQAPGVHLSVADGRCIILSHVVEWPCEKWDLGRILTPAEPRHDRLICGEKRVTGNTAIVTAAIPTPC